MKFGRFDFASFGGFAAYAACSLVIPVCLVPLAVALGFPLDAGGMAAGGSISACRSAAVVAAMLFCGFLAGRWGVRKPVGVAVAVMGLGMIVAAGAPTFAVLLAALTLSSLGEGVVEGLGTPVVQKLHPAEPGRYINFSHAFWSVGVLVSVLLAGWLLQAGVSWRWIVGGTGVLSLIPAAVFLWPGRTPTGDLDASTPLTRRAVVVQAKDILSRRRFWVYFAAMFFAGGGEYGLTYWAASFIQLEFAQEPWAGGAGTAVFAAGMLVGRFGWGYLLRQHHLPPLIAGSAIAATALCLPISWTYSLTWLFVLLFLAGIATGPFWPSIQSYAADRLPVDTTMLLILLSCAGVPGCGALTWLMGAVGDAWGLRAAFYLVPVCFLIITGLMAADRMWGQANMKGH